MAVFSDAAVGPEVGLYDVEEQCNDSQYDGRTNGPAG